jgi:hypothetical protein
MSPKGTRSGSPAPTPTFACCLYMKGLAPPAGAKSDEKDCWKPLWRYNNGHKCGSNPIAAALS